ARATPGPLPAPRRPGGGRCPWRPARCATAPLELLDLDDLLPTVRAAGRAHAVGELRIAAPRARNQLRHLGLVVRAPLPLPLLRYLLLRNGHDASVVNRT